MFTLLSILFDAVREIRSIEKFTLLSILLGGIRSSKGRGIDIAISLFDAIWRFET